MNVWSKGCLVALRIAVGWHFLYEGQWKIDSDSGATAAVTSRYAVQAATARLHEAFDRGTPGVARADLWYDEIVKAFAAQKQLGDDQKARLADLRDRVKLAALEGSENPVNFDWQYVHEEVLKVVDEQEGERFTSLPFLQGAAGPFRPLFRALVHDIEGIDRLTVAAAHAELDKRYGATIEHFRRVGKPFTAEQQNRLAAARDRVKASIAATLASPGFRARIEDFKAVRQRVEAQRSQVNAPFSQERLDADRKKLDVMSGELLAFVNESVAELGTQTRAIATVEQLGAGPLPRVKDPTAWIDVGIKFASIAIGLSLLLGLFTTAGAIGAALLLATFYLASPPWPGLPAATMGGHFLYVDRNLIELVAALVIASTCTGQWAGLDFYINRLRRPVRVEVLAASRSLS
jgi:uncharacterized membrane protein YphA (DoxX/SURF4 family)